MGDEHNEGGNTERDASGGGIELQREHQHAWQCGRSDVVGMNGVETQEGGEQEEQRTRAVGSLKDSAR